MDLIIFITELLIRQCIKGFPVHFGGKNRALAVQDTKTGVEDITFMASRTLQFCPLSNNS